VLAIERDDPPKHGRCLFCLRGDRPFRSREHIIPESLGNTEFVLPCGIVCDKCNNEVLSRLDEALVEFPPVKYLRTLKGIGNKEGNVPVSRWGNATITQPSRGHLVLESNSRRITQDTASGFKMNLTSGGPIPASRYALIARALYKITLAFIYHDRGPEEAFATKYDELRKVILDEQASRHWLATPKDNPHHDQLSFSYQPLLLSDGREAVWINFDIFGVIFMTEMLIRGEQARAELIPPEVEQHFNISVV
jgi:hypothetical protein